VEEAGVNSARGQRGVRTALHGEEGTRHSSVLRESDKAAARLAVDYLLARYLARQHADGRKIFWIFIYEPKFVVYGVNDFEVPKVEYKNSQTTKDDR